jgi:hypothetical protein
MIGTFGGAIASSFGSAVCCAGPTVAASLGLSSAGLSAFTPYRPFFIVVAAALTWYAFHIYEKNREKICDADGECANPRVARRMKRILWVSTGLVLFFAFSPYWVKLVL